MAGEVHDDGFSLKEEIEMLEAIYIHELTIEGPNESISVLLHPSTGDEDDKQYVCMTLEIALPDKYPYELPSIYIRNPRGLSEAHIESIKENLHDLMESLLGSAMLYQIIDYAKESLTDNNVPSCTCAICLEHFQDHHSFTKTDCYHYFHCHCLLRYIEYHQNKNNEENTEDKDKQIVCPMCRLPITYNIDMLQEAPDVDPNEEKVVYHADATMKALQQSMSKLFNKQLEKGGIINVEEEKNRYLISLAEVPESSANAPPITDKPSNTSSITNTITAKTLPENSPTNKEPKPVSVRPYSSKKYRGRGGYRHRNEGRRTEDQLEGKSKSYYRSKEYNKPPREGSARDSNRKNDDYRTRRNNDNFIRKRVTDNERGRTPPDKGVEPCPEKGPSSSSADSGSTSKPVLNMRTTDTFPGKIESENKTKLTKQGCEISDRNTEEVLKTENSTATVSARPGAKSSSDVTGNSREKSEPTSQAREKLSSAPNQREKRSKNRRENSRPFYKESKLDDKRKATLTDNKKPHKSSHPDKTNEHFESKAPQNNDVSRPPPGFENVVKNSGGSRPPPGFDNKEPSIPKPPGF